MKFHLLIAMILLGIPQVGFGNSYITTHCNGTTVDIHLEIFNDFDETFEGLPIIVGQRQVGICAPEVIVDSPELTMPSYPGGYEVDFTVPVPLTDLYYSFSAYAVMPDGSHYYLPFATHETGCGQAVAARGYLAQGDYFLNFTPCPDACWDLVVPPGGDVDPFQMAPEDYQWAVGTGTLVDLYGTAGIPYPMPGDPQLHLTGIEPVPGGDCDAVPVENVSWGSIRARYR